MNERDELRDFIQSNMHRIDGFERWTFQAPVDMADAILAAGYRKPRTIATAEELDALPSGSVVIATLTSHHSGGWPIAYQHWEDGAWHRGARSASTHPDYIIPATVLYEPEATK